MSDSINDACCGAVLGSNMGEGIPQNEYPTMQELPNDPMPQSPGYSIHIEPLNFGYMVRVGCQSFAIETADKLVTAMAAYLADPAKVQKQWFAGKFLK